MKDPLSPIGKLYCGCLEDGGEEYEGGGGVWVGGAPGEGTARGGGGGMTHGTELAFYPLILCIYSTSLPIA